MHQVVISGSGVFTPPHRVSNHELVVSFNQYVDLNFEGDDLSDCYSDVDFVERASGIRQRYLLEASGVLDPLRMQPRFQARPDEDCSLQAEISVSAALDAMREAQVVAEDLDMIIVACSNLQRAYPAISIEVQHQLGAGSAFAFDMNVACASATFALQQAYYAICVGDVRNVLLINPEICSAHVNFKDRDSHFIFGDACSAMVVQRLSDSVKHPLFEVLSCRAQTQFSNHIRNNSGFLNQCEEGHPAKENFLFHQKGRKVFKEVCPMVGDHLVTHLRANGIEFSSIRRLWLHQANQSMNALIARRVLGRDASEEEAPLILDDYANTSSAGSVICFHLWQKGLYSGDIGVLCSFGAGYSVGSAILRAC